MNTSSENSLNPYNIHKGQSNQEIYITFHFLEMCLDLDLSECNRRLFILGLQHLHIILEDLDLS